MGEQPKVSVIMPSLNVAQYIRECMDSVVNQTLGEIEIICVDAGSTDGTLEILQEYAVSDDRVRIINSDKKSYGYQMNLGIAAAQGEYFGIVETDDYVSHNMYEELYKCIAQNKLDVVKSLYRKVDSDKKRGTSPIYSVLNDDPTHKCEYNRIFSPSEFLGVFCIQPTICTALYSLSFIRKHKIEFNETPGAAYQDVGFAFKVLYCAERVMVLDKAFHYYRTDNAASSSNSTGKVFSMADEYDFIEEFLTEHPANRSKVLPYLIKRKFSSYLWTYTRVAPEHQKAFYIRLTEEYLRYAQQGLIHWGLYSEYQAEQLRQILRDDKKYFKRTAKIYAKDKESGQFLYPRGEIVELHKRPRIIVSLTSYPARISAVSAAINSLLCQTMPADMIVLWLAREQFPNLEQDLPSDLLNLASEEPSFFIRWCTKDLKSHKKYYYTMQEFPEDIVILADDDLLYGEDTIEKLYHSYLEFPNCVSALRCHMPRFIADEKLARYNEWMMGYSELIGIPSLMLFSTSGGGTLYPPHCMHKELFNEDAIQSLCLYADDVWLKIMQLMNNTPTVMVQPDRPLNLIKGTQDEALWHSNMREDGNDKQLDAVLKKYNNYFGEGDTLLQRMKNGVKLPLPLVKHPKVSIIVPVYNAAEYLKESIESICSQTLQELEVIFVNDGSTDDSLQILHAFAKRDTRLIVISQKNQGSGVARNIGIMRACGEYIAFLDADDMYPSRETLERIYTAAVANHVEICGGSMQVLMPNGKIKSKFEGSISKQSFSHDGICEFKDYQFEYGYQRFIYDRKALVDHKILFPPYRRFQDPPFMVNAMTYSTRFYHLEEATYVYREGHKTVNWTVEKVCDLIGGLNDLLNNSSVNRYAELHARTIYRFGNDFYRIISTHINHPSVVSLLEESDRLVDRSIVGQRVNTAIKPLLDIRVNNLLANPAIYMNAASLKEDIFARSGTAKAIRKPPAAEGKNLSMEKAQIRYLEMEIDNIKASWSFRIGRFITFIPRKVRGGIRCYQEHGFSYTWQRLLVHLHLKQDPYKR